MSKNLYRIIYDAVKGVGGSMGALGEMEVVIQCKGLLERGYMIDHVFQIDLATGRIEREVNWWELVAGILPAK